MTPEISNKRGLDNQVRSKKWANPVGCGCVENGTSNRNV